jgi:hypothetical protein
MTNEKKSRNNINTKIKLEKVVVYPASVSNPPISHLM